MILKSRCIVWRNGFCILITFTISADNVAALSVVGPPGDILEDCVRLIAGTGVEHQIQAP